MSEPWIGRYMFKDGVFHPDSEMVEINKRLGHVHLLADVGDGVPSFYFDPSDSTYWQVTDSADYSSEMRPVERGYIADNFSTIDLDRFLT